jgi:hypothetical protein
MVGAADIDHCRYFLAAPSGLSDNAQALQQAFLAKRYQAQMGRGLSA